MGIGDMKSEEGYQAWHPDKIERRTQAQGERKGGEMKKK